MKATGGEIVVRALEAEGIAFTFGIPGTHNIELYDALAQSSRVRPVLVTDEQSASFMADGYARSSGHIACANLVPGAGLTHALSGVAEAFMDNIPMLVLGCGIRRDTQHAYQLHDVDQMAIVAPVTKGQFRPETGEELYRTIRFACKLALGGAPGPVFVEVPANLYLFKHEVSDVLFSLDPIETMSGPPDVTRVAELLSKAKRPLLYVGFGAAAAANLVLELAERLQSPVATTFTGKGVFPESHPLFLWPGFGDAAPEFVREIAKSCDATLAIGCRFGEVATGSYGMTPPKPLIHIDIDGSVLNRNFPADVGIVADARATLEALLERLPDRNSDGKLRQQIRDGHEKVWQDWQKHEKERVSPPKLMRALQARFGPEAIFTADSGNGLFLGMECLRFDQPRQFLAPVDYSCMGYAIPAALGAKLAHPDRPVIALAGDGALLMTGLEMITAASQRLPVVVVVLRDRELAQIAQFQQTALSRKTASELGDYDVATLFNSLGVQSLRLDRNADIEASLHEAAHIAGAGLPVVLDVAIDYSEKTYFTKGVVKTNLLRLPWSDRLRFVGRAALRKILP